MQWLDPSARTNTGKSKPPLKMTDGLFPRLHCRGLIEAKILEEIDSLAVDFRGFIAAASLKRGAREHHRRGGGDFRGFIAAASLKRRIRAIDIQAILNFRGFIAAASLKPSHLAGLALHAGFPRLHCRGLIEA